MTILWIKCESVLLIVALQTEEIDYKRHLNATGCSNIILAVDNITNTSSC
jgi:hypothetical protein